MQQLSVMFPDGSAQPAVDTHEFPPLGPAVRALMIWPRLPPSFWGFGGMLKLIPEKSIMPPLGLITIAALCPPSWKIRLIDRAFDRLSDEDLIWADLVMISAMHAQRADTHEILQRTRSLGRRTIIGGPYASSQPQALLRLADHVVVGEPDEVFAEIVRDLENGTARRRYDIPEKPDLTNSPLPRFDLLKLSRYTSMPVQFSRGCPFQCEFCDIITIYGRKPRTKTPDQVMRELDTLKALGWRKQVFIVDDNFIGNRRRALELALALAGWQDRNRHPFTFYTEASIDLAHEPELIDAMVNANFIHVFIGIESPSAEALRETRKFQNLRADPLECIRFIEHRGLWVTGGFIVGFDSDDAGIFDRQIEFIERSGIAWAMAGVLQAPPTTPLFDRMRAEGRLIETSLATSNFSPPNFLTKLPLNTLLRGLARMLLTIYDPEVFYERALRSLYYWRPQPRQHKPPVPFLYQTAIVLKSMWLQGICSSYRATYWRYFFRLLSRWGSDPRKVWLGFIVLMSGHHFIQYAAEVAREMEEACPK